MSAYYIDRFPVTNSRYRECFEAEDCPLPYGTVAQTAFADAGMADHPVVGISHAAATAFCTWDDGRRLPTEAEWEKALRGPAPRTNIFPWDGTAMDCGRIYGQVCGFSGAGIGPVPDAYDAVPGSRGYYGTELQFGGGFEWADDWYAADAYRDPTLPLVDPTGPSTGFTHVVRGMPRRSIDGTRFISYRGAGSTPAEGFNTFRCARSPI